MSRDILLSLIDPDPDQPRKHFDADLLAELARSVDSNGLAVPILVRPVGERFVIVHGERRYRAAQSLGWASIAAEVRDVTPDQAHWLSLVENVQRADLSPIEEAQAYQERLAGGLTQAALGERIGKSQSYIAHKLRLLELPGPIKSYLERGLLSEGHIRQVMRLRKVYGADLMRDCGYREDANFHETLSLAAWRLLGSALLDDIRPSAWPSFWFRSLFGEENPLRELGIALYAPKSETEPRQEMPEDEAAWWTRFKNRMGYVAEASRELYRYVFGARGVIPQWEATAFWWESLAVLFEMSVSSLETVLDAYLDSFYSALLVVGLWYPNNGEGHRRLAESRHKQESADSYRGDHYLADLEACCAVPLAWDDDKQQEALRFVGGKEAPLCYPTWYCFGPGAHDDLQRAETNA